MNSPITLGDLRPGQRFKFPYDNDDRVYTVGHPTDGGKVFVGIEGNYLTFDRVFYVEPITDKPAPLRYASIKTVFPSEVSVTSHEIAKLITELDSVGQAEVLNELARLCKTYMSTQLQSIADNQLLTGDAKYFMKKVGDYSGI